MNFTVNTFQTVCPDTHLQIEGLAPYVTFMLLVCLQRVDNTPH
jgi:hypothetical protein